MAGEQHHNLSRTPKVAVEQDAEQDRQRRSRIVQRRVASGSKIKFREDIVDNFEKAPQAFIGLFKGKNFGKLIIPVAKD